MIVSYLIQNMVVSEHTSVISGGRPQNGGQLQVQSQANAWAVKRNTGRRRASLETRLPKSIYGSIFLKVHLFIKEFLSKTAIFDKTSRYLITNSELFDGDIHFLFSNTTKFVKYLEVLSNITVFDRNSSMKRCTFT